MARMTGAELQAQRAELILRDLHREGKPVRYETAMAEAEKTFHGALPFVEKEDLVHAVLELHAREVRAEKATENGNGQEASMGKGKAVVPAMTKEDMIELGADVWRDNPEATSKEVYEQLEREWELPISQKNWVNNYAPTARRTAKGTAKQKPKPTREPVAAAAPAPQPEPSPEPEPSANPAPQPAAAPPFTPSFGNVSELFASLFGHGDSVQLVIGRQRVNAAREEDGTWRLKFTGVVTDAELDGFMQHVWTVGRAS